jgi:site-specific recombinase XerD
MAKSITAPTFAGSLVEAGHDLVTVQKLMGHATPETTRLYDRRAEETKRRAVRSLHVPYKRKQQDTD